MQKGSSFRESGVAEYNDIFSVSWHPEIAIPSKVRIILRSVVRTFHNQFNLSRKKCVVTSLAQHTVHSSEDLLSTKRTKHDHAHSYKRKS